MSSLLYTRVFWGREVQLQPAELMPELVPPAHSPQSVAKDQDSACAGRTNFVIATPAA